MKNKIYELICTRCLEKYFVERYRKDSSRFCTMGCMHEAHRGVRLNTGRTHFKKGTSMFEGKKHTAESNERNRLAHLGKRYSVATEFKRGQRPWNWKGGNSTERQLATEGTAYKTWRHNVFVRDGWQCVQCGSRSSIQADHILPWVDYKSTRYDVANGQTLCRPCHYKKTRWVDNCLWPILRRKGDIPASDVVIENKSSLIKIGYKL